jgi:hypothetical protein
MRCFAETGKVEMVLNTVEWHNPGHDCSTCLTVGFKDGNSPDVFVDPLPTRRRLTILGGRKMILFCSATFTFTTETRTTTNSN